MAAGYIPDSRPIPDPTVLTTDQLLRTIGSLREFLESRINQTNASVSQLQELHEEKFLSIANQFTLRDVAVAAALKAAQEAVFAQQIANKEANSKMEAAFTKQIDQMQTIMNTTAKGSDDKIDDIKGRITLLEGTRKGASDIWGYIVGAAGVFIALASLVVVILFHH